MIVAFLKCPVVRNSFAVVVVLTSIVELNFPKSSFLPKRGIFAGLSLELRIGNDFINEVSPLIRAFHFSDSSGKGLFCSRKLQ